MAYQLRSRGDPVFTESQEQTDTSGDYLTEHQVTTPSSVEIISSQLSIIQSVATATAEADRALVMPDISTKPDVEIHPQLDIQGPIRPDPDLDSAPSTVQPSLAEEVGPPSTVRASRDDISTANETTQLYDTIDSLLLLSKHDSQEVKQTKQHDITIIPYTRRDIYSVTFQIEDYFCRQFKCFRHLSTYFLLYCVEFRLLESN